MLVEAPALCRGFYHAIIKQKGGDEMDVNTITTIISTVGFPIACCIYLVWNQNRADERHKDEIDKLRVSLDNNTKVINKLCNKLDINLDEKGDD